MSDYHGDHILIPAAVLPLEQHFNPVRTVTIEVAQFPATHCTAARTLIDILLATAGTHPEAPALDDGTITLTYAELITEIRDFGLQLADAGLGPGDRIGVRVPSGTIDLYVSILSVLMIGAAYVPVDVDDPDERARVVFTEAQVAATITAGRTITVLHQREPQTRPALRAPQTNDDCWIIFTSGSTGTPKGVAVTHLSAAAFVDAEANLFCQDEPLAPGDRVLAGLSVAFDASCEEMWLAWRHGACLVPAPRALVKSGMDLGPWLSSRGITVVSTVPTLAALWPAESLDNVRLLIFGGEACPPELAARLTDGEREVWNTYGPTEATVVACAAPLDGSEPIRIGLPLQGWELAVVDASGQPVAAGETGELIIGGVGLARYLDPDKDAEKYAPMPSLGWARAYRSGDLVVNDPAGLVFVGRADEQVKLGGRRIELGEIDAALQALPGVAGGAAAVKTTAAGTQVLIGYLAPAVAEVPTESNAQVTAERLQAWEEELRQELPAALVPRLTTVTELPTKTSGKVDRNALPWPLPGMASDEDTADISELGHDAQWIAEQWAAVLGTQPGPDSDFFTSGGGSLAAAQLVSRLRAQHSGITVGDIYAQPRFGALVEACVEHDSAATRPERSVRRTKRSMQWWQTLLGMPLHILSAMRWVVLALVIANVSHHVGGPFAYTPWWLVITLWLVFISPWGRMLVSAAAARLLLAGVKAGSYPRSGWVHMRLWLAEHIADLAGAVSVAGAPWVSWYAKLLGNTVGRDVDLHSVPPVSGMLRLDQGAAVEPEVDLKGWWVDGDILHIGEIHIGAEATVGARSTLLPGAYIGAGALIEPGSAVSGKVRKKQVYSGSPAVRIGKARKVWPNPPDRHRTPFLFYALGSVLHSTIPYLAALPGLAWMLLAEGIGVLAAPLQVLTWVPLIALTWFVCAALLIAVMVRLLGLGLKEGTYPVRSIMGFRVWATERAMDMARDILFPLYAGLLTPVWLRLLGAKVGPGVEASTVLLVPKMTQIDAGAFLADDTMIASYELGRGWMRIGKARVGKRAFLGNSGMTAAGRRVPKNALVAVLSAAPQKAKKGSSWLGSPPVKLRRAEVEADESLTYAPPFYLKVARGAWETLRLSSVVVAGLLIAGVVLALLGLLDLGQALFAGPEATASLASTTASAGAGAAAGGTATGGAVSTLASLASAAFMVVFSGLVMMIAGAVAAGVAVLSKWVLVGRIRVSEHPLWSSFIWRNEVADCFVELVTAPWFARTAVGTPALVWYLRALGAKIGHGVWCETYWLPEADLVVLADNSTVNRGCVVQTHLFHDRVMSLDVVTLEAGSTLGPNSVILPAATLGTSATVGPTSLVMRGEHVPAHAYFSGNPVVPWVDAPVVHAEAAAGASGPGAGGGAGAGTGAGGGAGAGTGAASGAGAGTGTG